MARSGVIADSCNWHVITEVTSAASGSWIPARRAAPPPKDDRHTFGPWRKFRAWLKIPIGQQQVHSPRIGTPPENYSVKEVAF